MNLLFLGSFIPDKYAEQIENLSAAANQFQYNLYRELSKLYETHALSYITIYTGGKIDKIRHELKNEDIQVFLPKDKNIMEELSSFRKALKKWIDWADCVMTYNVQYPWMNIGKCEKKILILADYTPVSEERWKKKFYAWMIKKSFLQYDKVVILSEKSRQFLRKNQEFSLVHGCIQWSNFKFIRKPIISDKIVFLYTGLLSKVTGVDILLRAFSSIENSSYKLVITGQGVELIGMIKEYQKLDSRIEFYGYVPKEEYLRMLEESNILINPRNMKFQQNTYNFPSKILEYLATGRIVVSTKFCGYEEFSAYINFADSDAESLATVLYESAQEAGLQGEKVYIRNRDYAKTLTWDNLVERFI